MVYILQFLKSEKEIISGVRSIRLNVISVIIFGKYTIISRTE